MCKYQCSLLGSPCLRKIYKSIAVSEQSSLIFAQIQDEMTQVGNCERGPCQAQGPVKVRHTRHARLVKLVDTHGLGPCCLQAIVGSNPTLCTCLLTTPLSEDLFVICLQDNH